MNSKTERQDFFNKANIIAKIAAEMLDGTAITTICNKYGVSPSKLTRIFKTDIFSNGHNYELERTDFFSWEDKFIRDLLGENAYVLPDFEKAYEITTATLNEREREVLNLRYKEDMTLEDIAQAFKLTKERVRQIEAKALRKLRHPRQVVCFKYGCASQEAFEIQRKIDKWQQEQAVMLEKIKEAERLWRDYIQELKKENNFFDALKEKALLVEKLETKKSLLSDAVINMDLSTRSYNSLRIYGIKTVEELSHLTVKELSKIKGLGPLSRREIEKVLFEKYDVVLKEV